MTEKDARQRVLDDLIAGNRFAEEALNREGVGITPQGVLELRVQALIDLVVGDSEQDKREFDIAYQSRLKESMEGIKKEVTRAKLTQGIQLQMPPGLDPRNNGHG